MILESVKSISGLPVSGVKLQLLHVLKGTDLADYYQHTGFTDRSAMEYEKKMRFKYHSPPSERTRYLSGTTG